MTINIHPDSPPSSKSYEGRVEGQKGQGKSLGTK